MYNSNGLIPLALKASTRISHNVLLFLVALDPYTAGKPDVQLLPS
jgi:hypothetical protein